jgi:hypothetical protein
MALAALEDEDNDGKDTEIPGVVLVDLSVLASSDVPSAAVVVIAGVSACSSSVASSSAGKCPATVEMIVSLF